MNKEKWNIWYKSALLNVTYTSYPSHRFDQYGRLWIFFAYKIRLVCDIQRHLWSFFRVSPDNLATQIGVAPWFTSTSWNWHFLEWEEVQQCLVPIWALSRKLAFLISGCLSRIDMDHPSSQEALLKFWIKGIQNCQTLEMPDGIAFRARLCDSDRNC